MQVSVENNNVPFINNKELKKKKKETPTVSEEGSPLQLCLLPDTTHLWLQRELHKLHFNQIHTRLTS